MTARYHKLLCGYANYIRRAGYVNAAAIALRTNSKTIRDVIAYIATNNKLSVAELRSSLDETSLPDIKYRIRWLATLGRICALQAAQEQNPAKRDEDALFGLRLLQFANRELPNDRQHQQFHRLEIDLLAREGQFETARELLETNSYLREYYYGYLLTDLQNPSLTGASDTYIPWLEGFNRPFCENGLLPVRAVSDVPFTFDRLSTRPASPRTGGPKVTVIMTSFEPDPDGFPLAVWSILNQSWQNLELLIVDDASPKEYEPILNVVEDMDPRIRLIKLSVNGGTYNARNAGIRAATGQYITGQDSDDWSHPERIERQVEHLIAEPSSAGVVVEGIRMDNDLIRMFPGRIPQRMCEVSLMLPLQLAREVGGYLKARKGADSEFRRRVEHYVRKKITFLELPLYLIRIGHASLSRADFKPGWSHPVRRAFWNASQHWHETSQPTSLSLENNPQPIPVPNKFKVFAAEGKRQFDVVFIDDGRTYGSRQRSIIDQMLLLSREDFRVGFMHLESILSPSKETTRLSPELQMLINNGIITEVIPDEDASSHVLVISDPTILQFSPSQGIAFTAHQTLLVPDIPQLLEEQGIVLYLPEECEKAARLLFSGDVRWTSSDPLIRDQLATLEQNITVSSTVMPIALNVHQWRNSRERLRGESPVIGRHSENLTFVWPKDELDAHQLWPSEDVAEVRILGDARSYLRKYGEARFPINWIVFRDKEIKPEAFMGAIDFFVYFPDEGLSQSYSREALEAVASGAIAILPPQFRDMHGDLAIYASPQEVQDIIRGFITNKDEYFESVKTDVDVIAERSNGDYLAYIESFGLKKQDQYSNLRKIAFN